MQDWVWHKVKCSDSGLNIRPSRRVQIRDCGASCPSGLGKRVKLYWAEELRARPPSEQRDACTKVTDLCLVMLRSHDKQVGTYSIVHSGMENHSGKFE